MEKAPECKSVQLEPFPHQVGGRSSFLRLDENTICKPLVPRELHFYETMPELLKKFTPQFKGVVEASFLEDNNGYIKVATSRPENGEVQRPNSWKNRLAATMPIPPRLRMHRSGSIEIESELEELFEDDQLSAEDNILLPKGGKGHNPWVVRCHHEQLAKIMPQICSVQGTMGFTQQFILLQNLTLRFQYPCVLDLKMGIRQYGDDATPAKIKRQTARVLATTSGKLGIRVCGMQVYQAHLGKYACRNKYYGRSLKVSHFNDALKMFLNNGVRVRTDVLPPLIRRLEELHAVMRKLDSCRFFTTSILLIYEGKDASLSNESLDVISKCHTSRKTAMERSCSTDVVERVSSTTHTTRARSRSLEPENDKEINVPPSLARLVDVHIIDFAHSTHDGMNDSVVYTGPDWGFIYGLQNLIYVFKKFLREL